MGMFSDIAYDTIIEKLNTEIEKRRLKIANMDDKNAIKKEKYIISGIEVAIKTIRGCY